MQRSPMFILASLVLLFTAIPALAGDNLVQGVVDGCKKPVVKNCQIIYDYNLLFALRIMVSHVSHDHDHSALFFNPPRVTLSALLDGSRAH